MSQILVTGASGQLGKSIRNLATSYPSFTFHFASKADLDICNKEKVDQTFVEGNFDYCINCAAYTNVEQSEKTPEIAFKVNEMGVYNLAQACKETKVVLIHISTDYVFDGTTEGGYYTTDEPNPINEYGKSKLAGERRIQEILKEYFIIRTSWLYSNTGSNFYTKILKKAKKERTIYVTTQQKGCPTHADHLGQYILDLISMQNDTYGIHHFTDGEVMTWYDFAKKILAEHHMEESVIVAEAENYRTFAKRPKNSVLLQ